MTAIVTWRSPGAALIAADRAIWWPDGTVMAFERKLVEVHHARSVVAAQGVFSARLFRRSIRGARDLPALLERVTEFVATNPARIDHQPDWTSRGCFGEMRVFGASWVGGEPVVWFLDPGEAAVMETSLRYAPDIDLSAALGRSVTCRADVATLTPQDAVAIMKAQRSTVTDPDHAVGAGVHLAGGGVDLAVVHAGGIAIQRVHAWASDQIGERIEP